MQSLIAARCAGLLPGLEIGERVGTLSFHPFGGRGHASEVAAGRFKRTNRAVMLLLLWANILPQPGAFLFSPSSPAIKSVRGTALCHEDSSLEPLQRDLLEYLKINTL